MSTAALKAKAGTLGRAMAERLVEKGTDRMREITGQFAAGDITEAAYSLEMRSLIKSLHMGAQAVGSGGRQHVTAKDLQKIGPVLKQEYGFLARKIGRIQGGEASAAQEVAAVGGYAVRVLDTYEKTKVAKAPKGTRGRWTLHSGESCPGCRTEAARGVQDVHSFPPRGSHICGRFCRCEVVIVEG